MPTGAVYQPTTVTYEQQPTDQRWNCPVNYFSRRVTSSLNRATCGRLVVFVLGGAFFITGLVLTAVGGVQYVADETTREGAGLGMLVAGATLLTAGPIFIAFAGWGWPDSWNGSKDVVGGGAAALGALNPSTDPLVAAQYAPVRDAPPVPDDEMRNLMDNKECLSSAEESDKMLDGRPSVA